MYGKIFSSMYEGSMVGAGPVVFAVWGYCIAKADVDGTVLLNPALLAPVIGTSRTDIEAAIKFLCSPDEHSKNPDHEGRRLLVESGHLYFVVSHAQYRGMKNNEDRREYMREYMKRKRSDEVLTVNKLTEVNAVLTKVNPASASSSSSVSDSIGKEDTKGKGYEIPKELEAIEGFNEALTAWKEFRKALKKPATDRIMNTVLKRLRERPLEAIAAIDTCITAGWTDIRWVWVDNRNREQGFSTPKTAKPSLQPRTDVDPSLRIKGYGQAVTLESRYGGDDE